MPVTCYKKKKDLALCYKRDSKFEQAEQAYEDALQHALPGENKKRCLCNLASLYRSWLYDNNATSLKSMPIPLRRQYLKKVALNMLEIFSGTTALEPFMADIKLSTIENAAMGNNTNMPASMEGNLVVDQLTNVSYIISDNGVAYSMERARVGQWMNETVVPLLNSSLGFETTNSLCARFKKDHNIDLQISSNNEFHPVLELFNLGRTWIYKFGDLSCTELPKIPVSSLSSFELPQFMNGVASEVSDEQNTESGVNDAKRYLKSQRSKRTKSCGK